MSKSAMWFLSFANRSSAALWTAIALSLTPVCGLAALGEPITSLQSEVIRHAATLRSARQGLTNVHVLQMPDGSQVSQFSGSDGIVYMVAWSTRGKPRLDIWLGAHFSGYTAAAALEQRKRAGVRHGVRIDAGDLVVQSYGHSQAFVGQAWLRSRVATSGSEVIR